MEMPGKFVPLTRAERAARRQRARANSVHVCTTIVEEEEEGDTEDKEVAQATHGMSMLMLDRNNGTGGRHSHKVLDLSSMRTYGEAREELCSKAETDTKTRDESNGKPSRQRSCDAELASCKSIPRKPLAIRSEHSMPGQQTGLQRAHPTMYRRANRFKPATPSRLQCMQGVFSQ
eukprot:m.115008 g.115008  ORF g.115008 m.115008 type:complete len:175 (-) comp13551_c0_seq1:355-879(-)